MSSEPDTREYDCERCGIPVIWCVRPPPNTRHCPECAFILGIDDPVARREIEEHLARVREPELGGEG